MERGHGGREAKDRRFGREGRGSIDKRADEGKRRTRSRATGSQAGRIRVYGLMGML